MDTRWQEFFNHRKRLIHLQNSEGKNRETSVMKTQTVIIFLTVRIAYISVVLFPHFPGHSLQDLTGTGLILMQISSVPAEIKCSMPKKLSAMQYTTGKNM